MQNSVISSCEQWQHKKTIMTCCKDVKKKKYFNHDRADDQAISSNIPLKFHVREIKVSEWNGDVEKRGAYNCEKQLKTIELWVLCAWIKRAHGNFPAILMFNATAIIDLHMKIKC